jgi:hypothetical protein
MADVHRTSIETSQPLPLEVHAGTDVALKIKVACASGCDLRNAKVDVAAASGAVVTTQELATYDKGGNETVDFTITVPEQIGEYAWSARFLGHERDGVVHEGASLPISFRTIQHPTGMAVWGVPSPVTVKSSFTVNVGVQCSAGCRLAGRTLQLCDEAGKAIGEGILGDTPWNGTSALYWVQVELAAPPVEGVYSRSAKFVATDPLASHEEAAATFHFRAVRPPEHRLTVTVADRDTHAPVGHVEVRLGFYAASTDERGALTLTVPKGTYELTIRKEGYQAPPVTVEVAGDRTVTVEAGPGPTRAQVEAQIMKFEDYPWA